MDLKNYSLISGIIFLAIALLHAARIVYSWDAVIGGWTVPLWLSWVALVISGYLAYQGLISNKNR